MFKSIIILCLFIAAVNCGGCPHAINKRQVRRGGKGRDRDDGGRDRDKHKKPPKGSGNNGDRRPRPTTQPTQPPHPVNMGECNQNSKYRTFDGSCNNLRDPNLGKAHTSFKRYVKADYRDGFSSPRTHSVNGNQLPNPRLLTRFLMNENTQFESDYSDLLVYFGQWLAHDLTEILDTKVNGEFVQCPCGSTDRNCLPYQVPANDGQTRAKCFEFTRSTAGAPTFRGGQSWEQTNFLTSFIDGTQVYGKSVEVSNTIRAFYGGRLATSHENYLPRSPTDFSCSPLADLQCFIGGEDRASENLGLTGVHTLFMREHNRIAGQLEQRHSNWNDETLFQEARRINVAEMQHIIYNEWLPTVIGENSSLKPRRKGYYTGYDQNVNPALSNEFATAAFRFGHTLIRSQLDRYDINHRNLNYPITLQEIIFDSTASLDNNFGLGGLEKIFTGLLEQGASKFDASIVSTLRDRLFEFTNDDGTVSVIDLPATNINRARDHGIPAYYKYREFCGQNVNGWNSFASVMSNDKINLLKLVYADYRDVDLFVGGLHETPAPGALVGPTFACIIKKQFEDLKKGDRFYYENGQSSNTRFTSNQLDEIRKTSMSRLICDNFGLSTIQENAFKMPHQWLSNSRTACSNLGQVNLKHF